MTKIHLDNAIVEVRKISDPARAMIQVAIGDYNKTGNLAAPNLAAFMIYKLSLVSIERRDDSSSEKIFFVNDNESDREILKLMQHNTPFTSKLLAAVQQVAVYDRFTDLIDMNGNKLQNVCVVPEYLSLMN